MRAFHATWKPQAVQSAWCVSYKTEGGEVRLEEWTETGSHKTEHGWLEAWYLSSEPQVAAEWF